MFSLQLEKHLKNTITMRKTLEFLYLQEVRAVFHLHDHPMMTETILSYQYDINSTIQHCTGY